MRRDLSLVLTIVVGMAMIAGASGGQDSARTKPEPSVAAYFKDDDVGTDNSVKGISYHAISGALIVHPKGWDDVTQSTAIESGPAPAAESESVAKDASPQKDAGARASMFYVYYKMNGERPGSRPITFLFNGGPGSSTIWLHMGAFGPRRVITANETHTPAAPYKVVPNEYTLLDASDLVFVDAPGTGFSRITGPEKDKAFYGVDQDGWAFADFITQFLSKYGRWNSPKYLFGESYGSARSAVLANMLEAERSIDLNGVMLLSQVFAFDMSADDPELNPSVDLPYVLALPTYAATAWYHNKLPGSRPRNLQKFLGEVQHFAMGDYSQALQAGSALTARQRELIVARLHQFTGLPVWYIQRANIRINSGMFENNLQGDSDLTTGRLDTRFSGPSLDPLNKEADYDPQSASISSAYVSAFNDYVRKALKYGFGKQYKAQTEIWRTWSFQHQPPGAPDPAPQLANVIPDLSAAMKYNPNLHIMVNGGYFDLATPYYEAVYEMRHLDVPPRLLHNIEFHFYESGHMVYAHEASLKQLHDAAANFIHRTNNLLQ